MSQWVHVLVGQSEYVDDRCKHFSYLKTDYPYVKMIHRWQISQSL